jgi:hypothetical protein
MVVICDRVKITEAFEEDEFVRDHALSYTD